ncbi:GIY-YIG nuclease family protein [Sphingobacterium sp. UT-1RO-CII-1]|uniref:GIY-YIG nuclease family protein n=1 Tax=Sphingobacterium sp. UT-1RO-CII-1 TaxID=2995225 RepID=UPI00227C3F90|nr:GIY-YIG nuclease family protein [Sphingobacterium sp. UT-1RO-CII-1]MCY4779045.1 GIY-YIG nuclease family protein [Sphingobacterium sp. UT-1RO-CII-1]
MQKHYIYIITNSNRAYLEIEQCQDISLRMQELKDSSSLLFSNARLTNIVYLEEFDSYELALKRKQQLEQFTRMQKERLIRLKNPNWLSLQPTETRKSNAHNHAIYA